MPRALGQAVKAVKGQAGSCCIASMSTSAKPHPHSQQDEGTQLPKNVDPEHPPSLFSYLIIPQRSSFFCHCPIPNIWELSLGHPEALLGTFKLTKDQDPLVLGVSIGAEASGLQHAVLTLSHFRAAFWMRCLAPVPRSCSLILISSPPGAFSSAAAPLCTGTCSALPRSVL